MIGQMAFRKTESQVMASCVRSDHLYGVNWNSSSSGAP